MGPWYFSENGKLWFIPDLSIPSERAPSQLSEYHKIVEIGLPEL